ncbi:unnamed protein product [Diplocarpon coronariae]
MPLPLELASESRQLNILHSNFAGAVPLHESNPSRIKSSEESIHKTRASEVLLAMTAKGYETQQTTSNAALKFSSKSGSQERT